jgi:REP element-mobilizing transposase RayT
MVASVLMEWVEEWERRWEKREKRGEKAEEEKGREQEKAYFHVTSRCHLSQHYLEMDRSKELLGELCRHYARVFEVELLDYCFMDNHLHLEVGVERERAGVLAKFVGCIKQQFTREYKAWFNEVYRKADRYRKKKMGRGTLWDGPYQALELDSERYLGACTLYIENNRVMEAWGEGEPTEEELVEWVKGYEHQSGGWYLGGRKGEERWLTDGKDGEWATEEEGKEYGKVGKGELPRGWRKVWVEDRRGIMKETPAEKRSYGRHPYIESLGETAEEQGEELGRQLMMAYRCTKERKRSRKRAA